MDAPPVRYARTSDGVSIGFAVSGSGPALLHLPSLVGNVQDELEIPSFRDWYARLSALYTLIRFDRRGQGLSQRTGFAASIDDETLDLEAVIDAAGVAEAHVLSPPTGGYHATKFVAEHPDRVRSLTTMTFGSIASDPGLTILTGTNESNWPVSSSMLSAYTIGWAEPADARRYSEILYSSAKGERIVERMLHIAAASNQYAEYRRSLDVPVLVLVGVPTAERDVGQHERERLRQAGQIAASEIPGAVLRIIEGSVMFPGHVETRREAIVSQIQQFTETVDQPAPPDAEPTPHGFQTILFTDLEASTPLTERLGDEGAQEILRDHNTTVRGALDEHDGREVKHTGDGIMASFPSAVSAVTAALQIQRELAGGEVRVRVGLNAGEPIAEDDDLFGTAVQLAARVTDRAEPGKVLVTNVVRELCAGKTFQFASIGSASMKGFDDAIELYEVTAEVRPS